MGRRAGAARGSWEEESKSDSREEVRAVGREEKGKRREREGKGKTASRWV